MTKSSSPSSIGSASRTRTMSSPVLPRRNPMVGAHTESNGSRTCAVACCGGSRTVDACCCCSTRHRTACDPCGDDEQSTDRHVEGGIREVCCTTVPEGWRFTVGVPHEAERHQSHAADLQGVSQEPPQPQRCAGVLLAQITSAKVRTRTCTPAKHARSFLCFFTCDIF